MKELLLDYAAHELGDGFLLIACGLPATFKTETTQEIARIKQIPIFRTDMVRLEVLKNEDIFDEKVASNMDKRTLVYESVFRMADDHLKQGGSAILDATFITRELRRRAAAIAARHGRRFIILQTHCPKEVSLQRIARRTREKYESNALTEQAYLNNQARFEAVDLADIKAAYPGLKVRHIIVDTSSEIPGEWRIMKVTEA
jgi:predicted kinase